MNRHDFWIMYAQRNGISQAQAKKVCTTVFNLLGETVKGMSVDDRMYIVGLGVFKKKKYGSHRIKDVNTGEMIEVPEKEKIIFEATE